VDGPLPWLRVGDAHRLGLGGRAAVVAVDLERELDACGFLRNEEARPSMIRNLRNMWQRAELTEQEVRTLHGMIKELTTLRVPRK